MTITVTDYVNVRERAAKLGCMIPSTIATLPVNFESAENISDLLQPSEAATVRTLFRNSQIPLENIFPTSQQPGYIQNNSFEWIAPTIFIGSSLLSENANIVSLALNVLASYVFDFFKGNPGNNTVKIEFIVETHKDHTCKTIRYEGDVSGISTLKDEILRISNE